MTADWPQRKDWQRILLLCHLRDEVRVGTWGGCTVPMLCPSCGRDWLLDIVDATLHAPTERNPLRHLPIEVVDGHAEGACCCPGCARVLKRAGP